MNRIKSLLGLISIVLALMFYPLGAEAQTVTVPPGTNISVRLLGLINIETAEQVEPKNLDDLPDILDEIAVKYDDRIDIRVKLNNSDRKYLLECYLYSVEQIFRKSLMLDGFDPDAPDIVPYISKALRDRNRKITAELAEATTVGDAMIILGTIE